MTVDLGGIVLLAVVVGAALASIVLVAGPFVSELTQRGFEVVDQAIGAGSDALGDA